MGHVYRVEIQVDNTSRTTDPADDVFQEVLAGYGLNAFDGSGGHGMLGAWNAVAIVVELFHEPTSLGGPGYLCKATPLLWDANQLTWDPIPKPYGGGSYGSAGFYVATSAMNDQSWFTGGGTLAIEKDTAGQTITFYCPGGPFVVPWAQFIDGSIFHANLNIDSSNWAEIEIASELGLNNNSPNPSTTSVGWRNLFFKTDGTTTGGHDLSRDDPGLWGVANATWSGSTAIVAGSHPAPLTQTQLAAEYQTQVTWSGTADPGAADQWWYIAQAYSPTMTRVVDMRLAPEHGAIVAAFAYPADFTTLKTRRTHDKGASWIEETLYSAAGQTISSPSVAYIPGRYYVVWHSGGAMRQSFSRDLGITWSTPVTLPIGGTNPRLVISRHHGLQFYFYIDSSGSLKLLRSGTFGQDFIDATAITVQTGVGQQTVAAEIASDGTLIVGYITPGSAWVQLRSRDLGNTWS